MCEFCLKHAEGKKWYLEARNYSEDLLSDIRRRRFIEDFFRDTEDLSDEAGRLEKLDKAPGFIKAIMRRVITGRMKKNHFGQVLPVEDVEKIFGFVNSVVRVACICRHVTLGEEKRYCYGISMGPNGGKMGEILRGLDRSFLGGPDTERFEAVSKEEALTAFRDHEREGLCHTVWTFQTPFIGGICNCDRSDCLAMRTTVTHDVQIMFRAEFVAEIDPEKCVGCRQCMRVCQFGAITYSAANEKAGIDQRRCYGCGICRAVCKTDAIRLLERSAVPAAARLW
jgi:Fe-S-cluster-containing hydrogenase component 2